MESWLLGWLIGSIAVLLIQYFVAREFQRIAEMKGHHEKRYFWITFFFWIVGMLLVIALPDLKNRELLQRGQSESSDASLPEI